MKLKILENKRGEISILLLVILILLVASAALFTLATSSGKVEAKIVSAGFLENLNLKQNHIEYYLDQAGKNVLAKTYKEFAEENNYINNPVSVEGVAEFGELHAKLKENFGKEFKENLKIEFASYGFEIDSLKQLKKIILDGNFEIVVDDDNVILSVDSLGGNYSLENIEINYMPKIKLKFNFEEFGLHSFEEVYNIKELCKGENVD